MTLEPELPYLLSAPAPFSRAPRLLVPAASQRNATLDEERGEVLAGVLAALSGNPPDPDEMAACSRLLNHLSETADRFGRRAT